MTHSESIRHECSEAARDQTTAIYIYISHNNNNKKSISAENSEQIVVLLLFLFTQKEELVDAPNESTSVVKICHRKLDNKYLAAFSVHSGD